MAEDVEHPQPFSAATALLVVDVQNDFADPAGSLYVAGGEQIVADINEQLVAARASGGTVVLTQDWHPPQTPHFRTGGGPWPPHCIRDTWGAELHPALRQDADLILRKGTGGEDGYSAFAVADPVSGAISPTGLAAFLQAREIRRVVVVGLAFDVCVRATAVDAVEGGLQTTVLEPLCRAVAADGAAETREALIAAGVAVRSAQRR